MRVRKKLDALSPGRLRLFYSIWESKHNLALNRDTAILSGYREDAGMTNRLLTAKGEALRAKLPKEKGT